MSNQLIINDNLYETRVAFLENGIVTEFLVERKSDRGIVGNIYLGKVQRVLPGMQAAFVELGLEKAAFLYVGDAVPLELPDTDDLQGKESPPSVEQLDRVESDADIEGEEQSNEAGVSAEKESESAGSDVGAEKFEKKRPQHRIEDLLKPGQDLLVQVTKDPIGTKGPRVTCNISLPGRHVVFMPTYDHIGISRKITDEDERERLKQVLNTLKPKRGGFVARTVSQGVPEDKLKLDAGVVLSIWQDVQNRSIEVKAPALVQPELDVILKCARDMTNEDIDKIVIDNDKTLERTDRFLSIFGQGLSEKLERYDKQEPIFEHFGVESEIGRAMNRKVWLRSGGYLVIDQAEALVVIDVNTGRFVGRRNLDETILRTNLEAVREVAYQLRLRNIGGMVIIDFIDMEKQEDRERVQTGLIEALKKDRVRCNVARMSDLALVEMTRQRTRESLERQLCEPCFYCNGKGTLKSKRTVAYEVFRLLEQRAGEYSEPCIVVHAHPEVVDLIYGEEAKMLEQIEMKIEKQVVVRPRGSFHQEQFDVFGSVLPNG